MSAKERMNYITIVYENKLYKIEKEPFETDENTYSRGWFIIDNDDKYDKNELICRSIINLNENSEAFGTLKINNFKDNILPLIKESDLYLIIVTSQNSLSLTNNHFQYFFEKELTKENNWKCLSKIDATKPIHSSSTFSKKSKKDDDPYNVKTRIYYRMDKVCLNFEDKKLSKRTCFTNKKSSFNEYNSDNHKKSIEQCNNDFDIIITNYYMKRYSDQNELLSKKGNGKITIGLIFKFKNNKQDYKLIISNRCNIENHNLAKIQVKNSDNSSIYIVTPNNIIKVDKKNDFMIKSLHLFFIKKISQFSHFAIQKKEDIIHNI
jgi:hypothetical protein